MFQHLEGPVCPGAGGAPNWLKPITAPDGSGQAMVFPRSAGTGTVIKPSTLRRYAEEAGFSKVEVLPIENPMFRFYWLTP